MFVSAKKLLLAVGALLILSNAAGAMDDGTMETRLLAGGENKNKALLTAAGLGDLQAVRELVQRGADANHGDRNLKTALHLAAAEGHVEVVKWLVQEADAQTDLVDHLGRTPLHVAARNGHLPVVRWLVTEGHVDLDQWDHGGYTALYWSVEHRHVEIARWLLSQGADLGTNGLAFPDFSLLSTLAGYIHKAKKAADGVLISQNSQWEDLLPLLHEYVGWNSIEEDDEIQETLEKLTAGYKCCCSVSCGIL